MIHVPNAGVAHPVERHLAKVEVASSSLVTRSIKDQPTGWSFFFLQEGRHGVVFPPDRRLRRGWCLCPVRP